MKKQEVTSGDVRVLYGSGQFPFAVWSGYAGDTIPENCWTLASSNRAPDEFLCNVSCVIRLLVLRVRLERKDRGREGSARGWAWATGDVHVLYAQPLPEIVF